MTLLPTLLVWEYLTSRSLRRALNWLVPSSAALVIFVVAMQRVTDGGFWIDIVDANLCARSFGKFFNVAVWHLLLFWIFAACAWRFSKGPLTSAHVWGFFAAAVGLATCGKAGADTMYFFDASAATALLAGLAINGASAKRCGILLCGLVLCVFISDRVIARTTAPSVAENYDRMLRDLRPYSTILSDEASIDIRSGRPWYWGDTLVLNALGTQGRWDGNFIEHGIAKREFSAIVVWNLSVWSPEQRKALQQNYSLWRTYPAFKYRYSVYLPLH